MSFEDNSTYTSGNESQQNSSLLNPFNLLNESQQQGPPVNYATPFGIAPPDEAEPPSKLYFKCIACVVLQLRGTIAYSDCAIEAHTIGGVRHFHNKKTKHVADMGQIQFHSKCQNHIIGDEKVLKSHMKICEIIIKPKRSQAWKERDWRNMFRLLAPKLPFPDTPYLNWHTWVKLDASDLIARDLPTFDLSELTDEFSLNNFSSP